MIKVLDLDTKVAAIGTALGLLKPGSGGPELDTGFFEKPWDRVGKMLSNEVQRAALVTAIEGLLPSSDPSVDGRVLPESFTRACHPLLEDDPLCQLYLVVEREGPAANAPLTLGLLAEGRSTAGPSLQGEITLLRAEGQTIKIAAASHEYPLRIEGRAPLDGNGSGKQIAAQLLVVGPPDADETRLSLRLDGLTGPGGQPRSLTLDPFDEQEGMAELALTLLQLFLDDLGGSASADLQRVAAQLPTLLGLENDLPPMPVDALLQDPAAFRAWLASLAQATTPDGRRGLIAWLDAAGQLLGAPALGVAPPAGTESDPVVIPLPTGAGVPEIAITAWLRTDPASGGPVLAIGLRASLNSPALAAAVRGEAVLLALPLTGTQPANVLESLDLRVDAPQGSGMLVDKTDLKVGHLRAGLRYAVSGAPSKVIPLLELLDVTLSVSGKSLHFDRLDLTDTSTLSSAAQSELNRAIDIGLGAGAGVSQALRTLLGLGTIPAIDLTLLASAPTQALADYYRRRRAASNGWIPILDALGTLVGASGAVTGSGTINDPWKLALDNFSAPASALAGLSLALWDEGSIAEPKLRLALRVDSTNTNNGITWSVTGELQLLAIDLVASGGGAHCLGNLQMAIRVIPPALSESINGIAVGASSASLIFAWQPGQSLSASARIEDAKLAFPLAQETETLDLGDIVLPPPQGFDLNQPDLGLGIDKQVLWGAMRMLLARCVGSWVDPAASTLLNLIGVVTPGASGLPDDTPPLLPPDGDLSKLLRFPLDAIHNWLADIIASSEENLYEEAYEGVPIFVQMLDLVQALLKNQLPIYPGEPVPTPEIPVYGSGSPDNPWAVSLHEPNQDAVELISWLEPNGPPLNWARAAVAELSENDINFGRILGSAAGIGGIVPLLEEALFGRTPMIAPALAFLEEALSNSDGFIDVQSALPDSPHWMLGNEVASSHALLIEDPVAVMQVQAEISRLTQGKMPGEWAVVLLAPPLVGAQPWLQLLWDVETTDFVDINLRNVGTTPGQVDLGGVTPALWYRVDLGDDGNLPLEEPVAVLSRVIERVRTLKTNAKVILVAHSYLGIVARAYTAAHPEAVLGLIALGSPFDPSGVVHIKNPFIMEAVRVVRALAPTGLGNPTLDSALSLLEINLDGYVVDPTTNQVRVLPFTEKAFSRVAIVSDPDLHGVPALAIAGRTSGMLSQALAEAIGGMLALADQRDLPTHLAWGARVALRLPPALQDEPQAELTLRMELGRVALLPGVDRSPNPPRLEVRARIWRDGGWLVGSAGDGTPMEARLRWVEFVGRLENVTDQPDLSVDIRMHDVAVRGASASVIGLDDPRAAPLLALLIETLDASAAKGGQIDALLNGLASLGLVRRRSGSDPAIFLADGLEAVQRDAIQTLAPLLKRLLDSQNGLFGLARPNGTPAGGTAWKRDFAPLPIELAVDAQPWRLTLRTIGDGLPIGPESYLNFTGVVPLASLEAQVRASLRLGEMTLKRDPHDGPLVLEAPWLEAPLTLLPGNPDKIVATLGPLVPRLLANGLLTLLLEQLAGGQMRMRSLDGLLTDPGRWLACTLRSGDVCVPDAGVIRQILRLLAGAAGLETDTSRPLALPGNLVVDAENTGTGANTGLSLKLFTNDPLVLWSDGGQDATLTLDTQIDIDHTRQAVPAGSLALRLPLPGSWGSLELHLGADTTGLAAWIVTGSGTTVHLLPVASGLGDLVGGAAQALLPEVLDTLVAALAVRTPKPAALDDSLAVAGAFDIYDVTLPYGEGFNARAQNLADLTADIANGQFAPNAAQIVTAAATLLNRLVGSSLVTTGTTPGMIGIQVGGVLSGSLELEANLANTPISVGLRARGLKSGPVSGSVEAHYVNNLVTASVNLGVDVDTQFGLVLQPRLDTSLGTDGNIAVALRPLNNNDVVISLAPTPAAPSPEDLVELAEHWLVPLAGTLLLRATATQLEKDLWTNGVSLAKILEEALVVGRDGNNNLVMRYPLPELVTMLRDSLKALGSSEIPLTSQLGLKVAEENNLFGLLMTGLVNIPAGDYAIDVNFKPPKVVEDEWGVDKTGVGLLLFDLTEPSKPKITPVLRLGGFGVTVRRKTESALLVDTAYFKLGGVAAFLRADLALSGPQAFKRPQSLDGAIELSGLGLPIAPGDNSSNPVAASMLKSDSSGDATPANPPLDLIVASGPNGILVRFNNKTELPLEIRRKFGPLYIEELVFLYRTAERLFGVSVDGGVDLAGFQVMVDDLTLLVPLDKPTDLGAWQADLKGLAVSYSNSSISIIGGLLKAIENGIIDYRGALSISMGGRGLTALGAYARPRDISGDEYTSMFIFVAISYPLGGPPYLFVMGLAGGVGYNRRLLVPRDPAGVPSFPLVAAMNDGGAGADSNPMLLLKRIGQDIPPSRGALWLAAGVRFTTFELLRSLALAYVSLDRGLEVGLLGLMQMRLPPADAAIVSVELALAARYSTIERVLSVRAALTNNSWLISKDCQLTGGFAFVIWFDKPDVLFSIGGYGPNFQPPAYYPAVPPVGFRWAVGGGIVVKGETYFTLTPGALMFGGLLEASYDVSPIRVWFRAALDVLVYWDPFSYTADISVSVGAQFRIKVCFIACVRITVNVSLGAWLHVEGPPLHGTLTVDLEIASVTVGFGIKKNLPYLTWPEVRSKYLTGGVDTDPATVLAVVTGQRATGAQPKATETDPLQVAPEFTVRVETQMPSVAWRLEGASQPDRAAGFSVPTAVDVVPAGSALGKVQSRVVIHLERRAGAVWEDVSSAELDRLMTSTRVGTFAPAIWDGANAKKPEAPMFQGLGGVDLNAPVSCEETTGALKDIQISKMVEEQNSLPLKFSEPVTLPPVPTGVIRVAQPLRERPTRRLIPNGALIVKNLAESQRLADATPRPRAPTLQTVINMADEKSVGMARMTRRNASAVRSATGSLTESAARDTRVGTREASKRVADLPPGAVHVWDVDPVTPLGLSLKHSRRSHDPVRVTVLSGTGSVLSDERTKRNEITLPAGATRVIISGDKPKESAGWELSTPLLLVGEATLIAPEAVVRLPMPWSPPARFRRTGEISQVPAWQLVTAMDGLTTDLPGNVNTVIVRLDARQDSANLDEVQIQDGGGRLGPARVNRMTGTPRVEIVLPVSVVENVGTPLSVQVTTGENWRLAGVSGWVEEKSARRKARTKRVSIADGEPVQVALRFKTRRRTT